MLKDLENTYFFRSKKNSFYMVKMAFCVKKGFFFRSKKAVFMW